ncbi:hypothetical protein W97_05401 [Coniosporium apollinis CBS 100218]|uniref:gamma-glutamylcyclotransferase n=1 Tax=Coniosporium apollinis (strain CBS 100218) TaxID=1168221 RepID=R7YWE7_CONA1|nr:uncharacterized protein W97_05401 [Coniosporium apollinis CBS 100218]EON66158.1 hypothetical protein W97_05401 [Coniosporium apollinis CBS 100218]
MEAVVSSMSSTPTLYFGYGSNLWLHQMAQRCPTSEYLGVARLPNYRWIINDRGYANVVQCRVPSDTKDPVEEVYGLVYSLLENDEARLDVNEGVPIAYTKEHLEAEFWPAEKGVGSGWVNVTMEPQRTEMLVYIDRERTEDDVPKKEYCFRINEGTKDALRLGVPQDYVDRVIRSFIPAKSDKEAEQLARKQALDFQDEREEPAPILVRA